MKIPDSAKEAKFKLKKQLWKIFFVIWSRSLRVWLETLRLVLKWPKYISLQEKVLIRIFKKITELWRKFGKLCKKKLQKRYQSAKVVGLLRAGNNWKKWEYFFYLNVNQNKLYFLFLDLHHRTVKIFVPYCESAALHGNYFDKKLSVGSGRDE